MTHGNIDTTSFEKAFGEKPNVHYKGCWHVEVNGKLRRLWGWWSKVEKDLTEWAEYGHQVRLLGSLVERAN